MDLSIYNEGEETEYRLLEEVAQSGEGDTWRAEQIGPAGRPLPVAVKILVPERYLGEAGADPSVVLQRWRGHAQVLRAFNQPGFATVQVAFEIGANPDHPSQIRPEWLGRPAFVMGWINGLALHKWDGSRSSPRKRLSVLELCAGALDMFHRETTHVHRDLKPSNIIVSPENVGTIIDFGLVRSMDQLRGESALAGSTGYMAPELYTGAEYSAVTDLYAFAGILFYQLTGKHPIEAGRPSRARELLADVGCGTVGRLLTAALAPHPTQRPNVAGAAELLSLVAESIEPRASRPRPAGKADSAAALAAMETARDEDSLPREATTSRLPATHTDSHPVLSIAWFAGLTPLARTLLLTTLVCGLTVVVVVAVRAIA